LKFLRRTPVQTFLLMPLATLAGEWAIYGALRFQPVFLLLLLWGYLQYRLGGRYRIARGGGGPGLSTPPERLVDSGIYAWTRNPMYLGHIIYMVGVTLTLQSWIGAALTLARAVWFHFRVLGDEKNLVVHLGEPYVSYARRVKRCIPGVF
jgi:protein-S-isoprenylcysteine O-methyltransferase Ste14